MTKKTRAKPAKPITMTDLWLQHYKRPGLSPSDKKSGMRLYVGTTGRHESWVFFYRHPTSKKLIKMTLPLMGIAEARKRISDDKYLLSQGIDPIAAQKAKVQASIDRSEGTLNAVAKRYLDIKASKLRSKAYYEGTLKRLILPKLGERPIGEIKRTEIAAVLDHVEQQSGASAADAAKRVLNVVMNWHQDRSEFTNPMARMKARLKPIDRARTHVPSDDEIKAIWIAAGHERVGLYGQAIRLLMLVGARRSEMSGLRRSEIEVMRDNGDQYTVWRLPASRSKNRREVVRPLSQAALDIIEHLPVISDSDYVFTLNGRSPMHMNYIDKKKLLDELSGVKGWRVHDLRRVFRSLCSRCRVPHEIGERLLGHSTTLLTATYDQHSHLAAMQEAVERVAAEIELIISDEPKGKVIRLR
jgi:integrase